MDVVIDATTGAIFELELISELAAELSTELYIEPTIELIIELLNEPPNEQPRAFLKRTKFKPSSSELDLYSHEPSSSSINNLQN